MWTAVVKPHKPNSRRWFTAAEEAQLRRRVYDAFDLCRQSSPYFLDAIAEVCDWRERTLPDRLERQARTARRA
jgi:hypothetical protein